MACRTDSPSIYSFAAEILYHAKYSDNLFEKGHCIKADLSVGGDPDDIEHKIAAFRFKNSSSGYVKEQINRWSNVVE